MESRPGRFIVVSLSPAKEMASYYLDLVRFKIHCLRLSFVGDSSKCRSRLISFDNALD